MVCTWMSKYSERSSLTIKIKVTPKWHNSVPVPEFTIQFLLGKTIWNNQNKTHCIQQVCSHKPDVVIGVNFPHKCIYILNKLCFQTDYVNQFGNMNKCFFNVCLSIVLQTISKIQIPSHFSYNIHPQSAIIIIEPQKVRWQLIWLHWVQTRPSAAEIVPEAV